MNNANAGTALQTVALVKRFGKREAVAGLDLRVPAGCAFGLLGPNGAGKTTVIRMVLGLTRPDAGTVRVLGRPMPASRKEALARVGAIVEEPRFHPHLTGRQNLRVAAAVRGSRAAKRAPEVLERVGLAVRADDRVSGYSLGMRQRPGIARCLLSDPELLILDEPMNGLDPAGMLQMRQLIRSLVKEGRTVASGTMPFFSCTPARPGAVVTEVCPPVSHAAAAGRDPEQQSGRRGGHRKALEHVHALSVHYSRARSRLSCCQYGAPGVPGCRRPGKT